MAGIARQVAQGFKWLDEVVEILDPVWRAALILGLISLAWLSLDRRPPFEVVQVYPAYALPGEQVQLVAEVRRDLLRHCAADMSRYIIDSRGTRWDEPDRHFAPETITHLARQSPDMLRLSIKVPEDAAPGLAEVISDLKYRCNVTHALLPIRTTVVIPFTVLRP